MLTSGETHVLALDVSGVLWGWGSNLDRQLLDSDETSFRSPRIIYNTEPIIWIGAGAYNSYALTESGQLICWGKNQLGQCGQSGLQNQAAQILSLPGAITDIAIGIDFGIVIIDAKLYAWGSNGFGQCGLEGSTLGRLEFTLIDESRPWTRCYAGGFHAMAFDDAGDLYVWGKNTRGQLGLGHTNPVLSPTLNNTSFDTQDIQMGYDFTLFLDVIGNLYSCGSNKYGQLGDGSYTEHTSPQFIANDISEIEAGPHSGWLSQYGSTFRWGKTPSGQFTNPTGLFSSQVLGNLTPREGTR
jgi:alpha-tubulin suppressor-like RCC1 family protein